MLTIPHQPPRFRSSRFRGASLFFCAVVSALSGCGGSPAPEPESPAVSNPASTGESAAGTTPSSKTSENTTVDPAHPETKWIGNIPYDVFYDQPLTVAANAATIGTNADSATSPASEQPEGKTDTPPMSAAESASAGAGGDQTIDWAEILPFPVLEEESKLIRTRLTANLNTVATYNKAVSVNAIAVDASILSALGAIATVHPNGESWESKGKFVRDLCNEMALNTGATGRSAYTSVNEPFEKLITVLDGGMVSDLEAEDVVPFADVVYTADLMKRIESTFNALKSNINTEARLKEDPVAIERELRILISIGTIIGTPGYDYVEEEKYKEFLGSFVTGARTGLDAVKTGNFESFQAGLNQMQTSCADCHLPYRSGSDGF